MTVATLEEMMEVNGGEEVVIRGEGRWVIRDARLRPVIGPKRHRKKPGTLRKRGSGAAMQHDSNENADTQRIIKTGGTATTVPIATSISKAFGGLVAPEPEPTSWLHRQRVKWHNRFYDEEFHEAVKHTAADVILWSVAAFSAVAAVRGVVWLVAL